MTPESSKVFYSVTLPVGLTEDFVREKNEECATWLLSTAWIEAAAYALLWFHVTGWTQLQTQSSPTTGGSHKQGCCCGVWQGPYTLVRLKEEILRLRDTELKQESNQGPFMSRDCALWSVSKLKPVGKWNILIFALLHTRAHTHHFDENQCWLLNAMLIVSHLMCRKYPA